MKICKVLGITFLVVSMFGGIAGTALAKTVTVDDSGGCDYTSIQEAINSNIHYDADLDEYYIDKDVTIIVYPGIYQESLKLSFPLSLKAYSSNPADTVIESGDYAITLPNSSCSSILISGFTIKGAYGGIYENIDHIMGSLLNITIENNVITDGNYGVRLFGDHVKVSDNIFENNTCGLYVDGCGPCEVTGNEFTENRVGLQVMDCSANVKNNLFTKNELAITSIRADIQIISNKIQDNKAGIYVFSKSVIASNVIKDNLDYGVNYVSGSGTVLYNNQLSNEINIISPVGPQLNVDLREGPNIMGGPSIGGNFWGNPAGTGFSQTCPDADLDGFCDEPYVLNEYSIDYLPLKEIASPPEPILPIANFSTNVTSGYVPLDVQFTDLSENTTQWSWDFGDGDTSPEQNTTHIYSAVGTYNVNLTAINTNGTDSKIATITVLKSTPTITWNNPADITYETALSSIQLNAVCSVPGTFVYTPPAGTILSVGMEQTLHVDFTPKDTANYSTASKDVIINVLEKPAIPVADFSASPTTGKAPLTVSFTDMSKGSPTSWSWNFGDKSTSTDQNPVHTYSKVGKFTVKLTVKNSAGSSAVSKSKYITVTSGVVAPVASFTASHLNGNTPLRVTFADTSEGFPTSWKWNFGDGSTSTEQNPVNIFNKAGTYAVKLTVKNSAGSSTATKSSYITVLAPPVAAFSASPIKGKVPLRVTFTDKSKGSPTSWMWSFGDGNTSTEQNPVNTYSKTGTYTITLTANNDAGSNIVKKSGYIKVKEVSILI